MRLIDTHKLEKEFKRIYNCDPMNYQSLDWGTIKNTIRDQPEVDPVKHGHWIKGQCRPNFAWFCSVCGGIYTDAYDHKNPPRWIYCPWCGAKMDEVTK